MEFIYADRSASITELKKNPSALIEKSYGEPIAILNNNKATAYLIPAETYKKMLEQLEDEYLGKIIDERLNDIEDAIEVNIDEL